MCQTVLYQYQYRFLCRVTVRNLYFCDGVVQIILLQFDLCDLVQFNWSGLLYLIFRTVSL